MYCILSRQRMYTQHYGQKTATLDFCNNFVKTFYSEMIIGT